MVIRTNLAPNPSFETNASDHSNLSVTTAVSATQAYTGTKSMKLTYSSSGLISAGAYLSLSLAASTTYTYSRYVYVPTGSVPVRLSAQGSGFTEVNGAETTVFDAWVRISITFTTTTAQVYNLFVLNGAGTSVTSGTFYYTDALMLEKSATLEPYFDGSTVKSGFSYEWSGAGNASTSYELDAPNVRFNRHKQPSAEVGIDSWTAPASTLTRSSTRAYVGTYSLQMALNGNANADNAGATAQGLTFEVGKTYTYSCYIWVPTGAPAMRLRMQGSGFTTVYGSNSSVNDAWTRISVTFTPTVTALLAVCLNATTTSAGGNTVWMDGVLCEEGSTPGDYFDGSSSAVGFSHAWIGTADNSMSYRVPAVTTISSGLSGSGTLTTVLQRRISGDFSGSGTLTSSLHRYINSSLSGSGTLTTILGLTIHSDFTGSGTLTSALRRNVQSSLNGSGTLSSALTGYQHVISTLSGSGTLTAVLVAGGGGSTLVLTTPLGKRVSFSVSTSAVPINPAEGSGATPSVNAAYIKTDSTEFALGETNVLDHGSVGVYEGEIVRLSLPEGSDVASIAQDTLLTLLNNELHLFPFIDAAPSVWTAARAVDYWTQQCGLFYDKVPGDCIAYASGFGHTDSYGAGNTARFYEKLVGGTTATTLLNNRSVKTLGSAVTGTTAFHELPKGRVAVSVPSGSKLVASIGLGLRGTGRTTTVTWNMVDSAQSPHTLTLTATSAGDITASVDGVPVASATAAPDGDYRVSFSVDGKLTVHTDDLDGNGAQVTEAAASATALPNVLYLTSVTHVSAGGSGAEMLRWGTYLTVAASHPLELPAVQKSLSPTGKSFGFVSGFEGNVWALLNEYCAITRQDVSFLDGKLNLTPRIAGLSVPRGNFSRFSRDSERRDKYKQVAVVNKQSKAVSDGTGIFWRADSVYQINAREVQEFTVQTDHSILSLNQPVPVPGIEPFPYKAGTGQYVVTGADGYIIAPQWWSDNGGKVEVSPTGKEGEIGIKITAPDIDTVRAPYRISEGEADRPALYVSGSGILNDPKEVHVGTGASNAKEGFDNVFESPFIAGVMETYDTAAAMAAQYSASVADVGFEIPNDFYTPSRFGQYPAGTRFTDGKRNYRIKSASQTHSRVSGSAVPHTTIGDYVASYPAGATLADEKARHAGRTIKQFNISPLRGSNETA